MRQFNVVYLCMTNERENFTDEIFLPIVLLSSMVTWLYWSGKFLGLTICWRTCKFWFSKSLYLKENPTIITSNKWPFYFFKSVSHFCWKKRTTKKKNECRKHSFKISPNLPTRRRISQTWNLAHYLLRKTVMASIIGTFLLRF